MRRWLTMQAPDCYASLVLLALALWVGWKARGLGLGSVDAPGPGFVYFWTAVLLGVLSARRLVLALRRPLSAETQAPLWRGLAWPRVLGVVGALAAYAFVLEPLGYVLTTFVFTAFLYALLAQGRRRWGLIVGAALATALLTYLVFDRAFSVQLPKGVLPF